MSFVKWSVSKPVIALGTTRGAVFFYSDLQKRKIPVEGVVHGKAIIEGLWIDDDNVVLCSEDKQVLLAFLVAVSQLLR